MKNADEILKFIDDYQRAMLARPSMYAATPRGLEDVLTALERVREFIAENQDPLGGSRTRYHKYLDAHGFGVKGYSGAHSKPSPRGEPDMRLFNDLSRFWRDYLLSEGRLPPSESHS